MERVDQGAKISGLGKRPLKSKGKEVVVYVFSSAGSFKHAFALTL